MIISNLKLKNFKSYEDETEFSFSPSGNKNIVLIGGENGAGKSTIFEAIKLCIYGPIAYGYQGHNSAYNTKIKANINHNAYKENQIDAYISITILLPEGTSENVYEISRRWNFEEKKLVEYYKVIKNGELLSGESINYFENYLTSLIPPNLFDFFFFDSEDLSDSFIGRSASLHLKESILQLCNFDTLDILKKQLLQYQRNIAISSNDLNNFQEELNLATDEYKANTTALSSFENDLMKENQHFEYINIEKDKHEERFRNAGGLLENEKNLLMGKLNNLEHERNNLNQEIKDFANDTLPLLINCNLLGKIKTQILAEDSLNNYNSIKEKLSEAAIKSSLIEANIIKNSNLDLSNVPSLILNKLFDIKNLNNINYIHLLSNDDKNTVLLLIDKILNSKEALSTTISTKHEQISQINEELKIIRQRINSAVNDSILNDYIKKNLAFNNDLSNSRSIIENLTFKIELAKKGIDVSDNKLKKAKNQFVQSMQSSNTFDISNKIVEALDEIIFELSQEKVHAIEENFMFIFNELIRKDNYINSIEVQNNFDTTLYIDKEYSSINLVNLINHLGIDDIEKKYGDKFIEDLMKIYPSKNKKELVENINNKPKFESLILRTKFSINDFSKGEKQIYILSLVWALIKSSGVQIPFVIDTPYGRIDEAHRDYLTTKYLPNISNQVIVLSTNEEIDRNLYGTMKPFICDEYLLQYLDNERKTKVHKGYFFEV